MGRWFIRILRTILSLPCCSRRFSNIWCVKRSMNCHLVQPHLIRHPWVVLARCLQYTALHWSVAPRLPNVLQFPLRCIRLSDCGPFQLISKNFVVHHLSVNSDTALSTVTCGDCFFTALKGSSSHSLQYLTSEWQHEVLVSCRSVLVNVTLVVRICGMLRKPSHD